MHHLLEESRFPHARNPDWNKDIRYFIAIMMILLLFWLDHLNGSRNFHFLTFQF